MTTVAETPRSVGNTPDRRDFLHDDRLRRLVRRRLETCGYRPLQRIDCRVWCGAVVLCGRVPSWYMKQVAQTVVRKLDDVDTVDNRLQVRPVGTNRELRVES